MVADNLWGSTPMVTSVMTLLALPRTDRERRGGQCYYELGSPLWSHASSRCPTSRSPCESHTHRRDGQPRLRASRRTPGPSLARHRSCAKSPSSRDPRFRSAELRMWRTTSVRQVDNAPHLIVLRGNAASGKCTLAAALQRGLGPGTANIEQDHFRRVILREHDVPDGE